MRIWRPVEGNTILESVRPRSIARALKEHVRAFIESAARLNESSLLESDVVYFWLECLILERHVILVEIGTGSPRRMGPSCQGQSHRKIPTDTRLAFGVFPSLVAGRLWLTHKDPVELESKETRQTHATNNLLPG